MNPHSRVPKNLRRKQAMEMRCYHKVLHISYKDNVINEKVHAKIQQAIGVRTTRRPDHCKRDTNCSGISNVFHSSGLAKTILQGTVKGEEDKADRGRGGRTGLEFTKS